MEMWFNFFSAFSFIILAYEKVQKSTSFQPMQNYNCLFGEVMQFKHVEGWGTYVMHTLPCVT